MEVELVDDERARLGGRLGMLRALVAGIARAGVEWDAGVGMVDGRGSVDMDVDSLGPAPESDDVAVVVLLLLMV